MKNRSTTHTHKHIPYIPKKPKSGYKIKGKHRLAIYKMIAMGMNAPLIAQEIFEDFGMKITRGAIFKYYIKNPQCKKIVARIQAQADKEVMRQPLAHARTRLAYLLRGINYALTRSTDKLYFYEGDLIGKLEKINQGALAPLIREAREEVALLTGKNPNDPSVHISLTTIIKDVAKATEGNERFNRGYAAALCGGDKEFADSLDIKSFGDIQILGRSSRHIAINPGSDSQE